MTGGAADVIREDMPAMLAGVADVVPRLSDASILITGVSGMIGGYLADLAVGINDARATSKPMRIHLATHQDAHSTPRLQHLVDRADVTIHRPDGDGRWRWPSRIDYIVHAASPAAPGRYLADPIGTLDANSRYLRSLLEIASMGGAQGVVYLSTSEVYGDPPSDRIPTPESFVGSTDPMAPRAAYVEGKRFGEALCMAYFRQRAVPVSIVRPFHVHGPGIRLDDGRIVAALMAAAVRRERFTLASDGSATRCYGYVADAVVGILRALMMGVGEVFNIGTDHPETTILELATIVSEIAGTPLPTVTEGAGPVHLADAPKRSQPDLSKARGVLGYATTFELREGLERTYRWCRAAAEAA